MTRARVAIDGKAARRGNDQWRRESPEDDERDVLPWCDVAREAVRRERVDGDLREGEESERRPQKADELTWRRRAELARATSACHERRDAFGSETKQR